MNEFEALVALVEEAKFDAVKFFDKGNKAAGTRLRKKLQEVKAQAQTVRLKVQEEKGE